MGQIKFCSVFAVLLVLLAYVQSVQGQSHGELTIQINAPGQSPDGSVQVAESASLGFFVGVITVGNAPGDATAMCSIDNRAFRLQQLDTNIYKIIIAERLDRELVTSYTLAVRCIAATTTREVTGHASLRVEVLDVNDNMPRFARHRYSFSVSESSAIGSFIAIVRAMDPDAGDNARLTYSVDSPDFTIDGHTGAIYLARRLDREAQSEFRMTVAASDMGAGPRFTGTAEVIITVQDVNDNAPTSAQGEYSFQAHQGNPVGTQVGTLLFMDYDEGANAALTSSLMSNSSPFALNDASSQRPVLVTSGQLGPEQVGTHHLVVIVSDQGQPRLTTTVPVTVTVTGN